MPASVIDVLIIERKHELFALHSFSDSLFEPSLSEASNDRKASVNH